VREGYEEFAAIGDRGYREGLALQPAEILYQQDRLDEAQQLIDQIRAGPSPDLVGLPLQTEAKLLARGSQFGTTRQIGDRAEALLTPTSAPLDKADVLASDHEIEQ